MLGNLTCFLSFPDFFLINVFKILFQAYHESHKQCGSTFFCRVIMACLPALDAISLG